jgi:hypothetical protein
MFDELVCECDCRLIERDYIYPADFKNWAIPQAQHEWILLLDADERVPEELAAEVRQVLEKPPTDTDGYWIGRRSFFLGYEIRHCGWNTDDVIRLFRRDPSRYEARLVHEEIDLPKERLRKLHASMLHYTTWSTDNYLGKLNRYADAGATIKIDRESHRDKSAFSMLMRAPLRFVQLYVLRLGFLDGVPGLQVCMFTAFYSFLKQAKHWEKVHALPQPDPEADRLEGDAAQVTIDFNETQRALRRDKKQRWAA